jgi:hypothetical protein
MIIYQAFIESELEAPQHLARRPICISAIQRVQTPHGVELVKRVDVRVQKSGPDSAVPGNSQARWFSRSSFQAELLRANQGLAVVCIDVPVPRPKRPSLKQNPARTFNSHASELGKGAPYGA